MARLHFVKKARKAIPDAHIEIGDSYYWWKFAYRAKQVSKTRPRRSALTQSEFYGQMYDAEDDLSSALSAATDKSGLQSARDEAVSMLRDIADEQEERRSNVEDAFPNGSPTIDLLQSRYDSCSEIADALEAVDLDYDEPEEKDSDDPDSDEPDDGEDELVQDEFDRACDELREVDWSYE